MTQHAVTCCCCCFAGRHLALSTNGIDRIAGLAGLKKLKILSLGRNIIRKIEKLDDVADSLEQLWISYNGYFFFLKCLLPLVSHLPFIISEILRSPCTPQH